MSEASRRAAEEVGAEVCRCSDCVPYGNPKPCDRARIADHALRVIDTAIARAVEAKDEWWKKNDVARLEEIVRLREEVSAWQRDYRTAKRAFEAMEQKLARATEGEKA